MSSEMTMHAAVSSVNCGLKVQPRALKKLIDLLRSLTGRLTKIFVLTIAPLFGVQALPLAPDGGESTKKRAIRLTKDVGGAGEPTILDTNCCGQPVRTSWH